MTTISETSVHNIETTASSVLPDSYQQWRLRSLEPEWLRTKFLYGKIDETEGKDRLDKLHDCRKFAYFVRHVDTGKIRVISNSCRLRWCPICSQVKSIQLQDSVSAWLGQTNRPKFLTLTYAHSSLPLAEQIKGLYNHFRLFRQRKFISDKWRGGIWFFQVKRSSETGEWHPHLHAVIDGDFIPQKELSLEWLYCTKSSYIVDIRAIRAESKVSEYVSRYCSRPSQLNELNDEDIIELFTSMHNRRLCGTWGTGKACSMRPEKVPDSSKWQRVGNYTAVIKQCFTLSRAKLIINSFARDHSVANFFTIPDLKEMFTVVPTPQNVIWGMEDFKGKAKDFI